MPPSLSISNILQALYESSSTIKLYVDCIASGRPAPYTLITKSTEHEKNEAIVKRLRELRALNNWTWDSPCDHDFRNMLDEVLDEAMILEEELYTVVMFKGDAIVEGSRQIVKGDKIEALKDYARFKGYEFSARKVDDVSLH